MPSNSRHSGDRYRDRPATPSLPAPPSPPARRRTCWPGAARDPRRHRPPALQIQRVQSSERRSGPDTEKRNLGQRRALWTADLDNADTRTSGSPPYARTTCQHPRLLRSRQDRSSPSSTLRSAVVYQKRTHQPTHRVAEAPKAQFVSRLAGADEDQMDRMRSFITAMCAGWDVAQVRGTWSPDHVTNHRP